MGNIITSLISGFSKVIGDLLGAPVDFLSGKSCSSKCGSTWDLICYIENFCIGNLLKLLAVSILFYIVLLFFYLVYKAGLCDCIGRNMCKILWACLASCFASCEHGFMLVWFKLKNLKQVRRGDETDLEMYDYSWSGDDSEERISYGRRLDALEFRRSFSRRSRERKRIRMERSLRPRSRRIKVGISRRSAYINERLRPRKHREHVDAVHDFKVTHTSKYVQKAGRRRVYQNLGTNRSSEHLELSRYT